MSIIVNLDVMLAKRKWKSKKLAEIIGITEQNLSVLKSGRAKAIRFSTLDAIYVKPWLASLEIFWNLSQK